MAKGAYTGVDGVARKVVSPYVGVEGVARNVKNGYVGVEGVARLFFAPDNGAPVILQVEKVTSDTYAGETTYESEEFILLDIYPKPGGTVNVTYGGLTKTITDTSGAEEPNAQKVFFGTFNGVSDSVATPASGELTIEGGYTAFGVGSYGNSKGMLLYAGCITAIQDWGNVKAFIPDNAFCGCKGLTSIVLPDDITSIGYGVFRNCTGLTSITIPNNVSSIESYAFSGCTGLTSIELNEGLKTIGEHAFHMPTQASSEIALFKGTITFPSTLESIGESAFRYDKYSGDSFYYTYIGIAIMLSRTPPTLGDSAFGHNGNYSGSAYITVIVPKGCVEAYKTAENWRGFAHYITEES